MELTLRSLRWEQSLSLSRRRRPHQSSGGVLAVALHVTSEGSKRPAGLENNRPLAWRDTSGLEHPLAEGDRYVRVPLRVSLLQALQHCELHQLGRGVYDRRQ